MNVVPTYIPYTEVRKAENKANMYCTFNGPKSKECKRYKQAADELYMDFMRQFIIKDDDDTSE